MAAPSLENVVVGRTGKVLVAPRGGDTVYPTKAEGLAFVPGPEWRNLGKLNSPGISYSRVRSSSTTNFWQDNEEMTISNGGSITTAWEMSQWDRDTVSLAFGVAPDADGVLDLGTDDVPSEVSVLTYIQNGEKTKLFLQADFRITEEGSFDFVSTDKTNLPVTGQSYNTQLAGMNGKAIRLWDATLATDLEPVDPEV